jgi:glycosyltransferase involved in cell wall biosynthesis
MRPFVGITGSGAIGIDPFDPRTWSGSSRSFFLECGSRGILNRAFGVEAPPLIKYGCALRTFSRDRARWRRKFYMDVRYRRSLTQQIAGQLREEDFASDFMQIGAMYDVPSIVLGRSRCFAYADGNFATAMKSPYFPRGIPRRKIDRILAYEQQVYSNLDMIFTMSEFLRRSFIDDFAVPPERVVHIGAGCNFASLPQPDDAKPYDTAALLFVGADFERKGGHDLLRAFSVVRKAVPRATLHIVGPPQPADNSVHPGVVWHGFLRKENAADATALDRLFRQASIFVLPSIHEPFGIAPMEAMSYCVACVATNICALPETVKSGVTGELVERGQWESLAAVLIDLLADPARLKTYGTAGREFVERRGTWPSVVDRLIAAISA